MSPKWAKKAHFGDISYNAFNRRKSSYYVLETLCFIYIEQDGELCCGDNIQVLLCIGFLHQSYPEFIGVVAPGVQEVPLVVLRPFDGGKSVVYTDLDPLAKPPEPKANQALVAWPIEHLV